MTPPPPDLDLLERFITGDQDAFAVLVGRYHGLVRATCARQADPGWDDDCVQAVFLVLSRRPSAALHTGNLPGWLVRTAWFVCRHSRRAAVRRQHAERDAAQLHADAMAQSQAEPEALAHLDDCLQKLPSRQRAAVTLHYLTGHPAEEVAAVLGITRDNAYQLLTRGVAGLRLLLARRGVALSAAALASLLAGQAQAASVAGANATGVLATLTASSSPTATTLANGAMTAMTIAITAPFALAASLLLAVGLTTTALTAEHLHPAGLPPADTVHATSAAGDTSVGAVASARESDDRAWRRVLENQLEREITHNFDEENLTDVVIFIKKVTQANIVIDPRVTATNPPPITLKFAELKARFVLDFIMKMTSLHYTLRNDGVFITLADPTAPAPLVPDSLQLDGMSKYLQERMARHLTVDFVDIPTNHVLDFLSQVSGVNLIVAPEVMAQADSISLKVKDMQLKDVFRAVSELRALSFTLEHDSLYVSARAAKPGAG